MDPSESSEEGDAVTLVRVYSGFRKKKKIRFNFLQKVMLCSTCLEVDWNKAVQHMAEGVITDVHQPIANQLPFVTSSDQLLFA